MNGLQAEIFELLAGAPSHGGEGRRPPLLRVAVGDAKQSIYRFRGADVGVFAGLIGRLARGRAGGSPEGEPPLDRRHRRPRERAPLRGRGRPRRALRRGGPASRHPGGRESPAAEILEDDAGGRPASGEVVRPAPWRPAPPSWSPAGRPPATSRSSFAGSPMSASSSGPCARRASRSGWPGVAASFRPRRCATWASSARWSRSPATRWPGRRSSARRSAGSPTRRSSRSPGAACPGWPRVAPGTRPPRSGAAVGVRTGGRGASARAFPRDLAGAAAERRPARRGRAGASSRCGGSTSRPRSSPDRTGSAGPATSGRPSLWRGGRPPGARRWPASRSGSDGASPPREPEADGGDADAVSLLSVHQAKGLEWPVVFVPELGARPPSPRRRPVLDERGRVAMPFFAEGGEAPEETATTARLRAAGARRSPPSHAGFSTSR